jgi:hypothetical protein
MRRELCRERASTIGDDPTAAIDQRTIAATTGSVKGKQFSVHNTRIDIGQNYAYIKCFGFFEK